MCGPVSPSPASPMQSLIKNLRPEARQALLQELQSLASGSEKSSPFSSQSFTSHDGMGGGFGWSSRRRSFGNGKWNDEQQSFHAKKQQNGNTRRSKQKRYDDLVQIPAKDIERFVQENFADVDHVDTLPHEAISELTGDQAKAMVSWLSDGDLDQRNFAMEQIMGLFWQLSTSQQGSRVVQKALELAELNEKVLLAEQLKGHVRDASKSPHANYVVQKCIELLPPVSVQFMIDELQGRAVVTARHRFGCRILQRLIEHCPGSQVTGLIDEVMTDADRLCRHPFGNFVLQHVLEHGSKTQQSQVVDVLVPDAAGLARHRIASHVLQRALSLALPPDRDRLADSLAHGATEPVRTLATSQFGSFVMREVHGKRPKNGFGLRA